MKIHTYPYKLKQTHSQGFTLIELMMVVVILGILATIALPNYLHYAKRAKFSEVISATSPYKLAVELCFQEQGDLKDCQASQHSIPPAIGNKAKQKKPYGHIASLSIVKGIIKVTSTLDLDSKTFILTPVLSDDKSQLTWISSGTCKDSGFC